MTDERLKNLLGFLLRNKDAIFSLLDNFKPEDIENGLLAVPDSVINRDLKMLIIDKASPYLNDYMILFQQNSIILDLDIDAKQLGRLKAKYMLTVVRFDFQDTTHQIQLAFREDVRSKGNFMQNMAVKAAGLKGSYLQLAAEMAKTDFLRVEKDNITIDIDALDAAKKIPPSLKVDYISSEDGILKLRFHI
jgi:hypothetical protein